MASAKEKIIDEATKLFFLNGYKNTSINSIVETIGVSKGVFFYHFKDKQELFGFIIDNYYDSQIKKLLDKTLKAESLKKEHIISFYRGISKGIGSNKFKGGCLLGNMTLELADNDELYREKLIMIFSDWEEVLIDSIKKIPGKTKNTPEEIANYIICSLEGLILSSKVFKNKEKNDKNFDVFVKILGDMLGS
ncbi:TetR/AcrR family transcriptional regulator [Candidatus Gracilibacteria bacterium 28_42_T64]|nr:TetR/AcrR family transcriptional regulator [Candidatus Gracilibacteria bacterium 28_42_T64]